MLDRLIDVALQWLVFFVPFVVIDEFERAVVLRFGRFHREIEPGFHWLWPCEIERAMKDNVVPRTHHLGPQSLMSKDGRNIVVSGVITSSIRDIRKALLEVEGVDHALEDSCFAAIGAHVSAATWAEITHEDFSETLTKACRKQAWRYGIEIQRVQLSDLSPCRSIRLLTSGHT